MHDYFKKLAKKVRKYSLKYEKTPRKAAIRLTFWNFICCFRRYPSFINNIKCNNRIAIKITGGIGDILIGCNYINILSKKFNSLSIDIYSNKNIIRKFIDEKTWNGNFIDYNKNINTENYDTIIDLIRYPNIIFNNTKITSQPDEFSQYIKIITNFKLRYPNFFDYGTSFDGVSADLSSILGKKRIQQPDIDDFLSIKEDFSYDLPYNKTDICQKQGLIPHKFITIHRGCDTSHSSNSIKLWPMEHYNTLIKKIKEHFPEITVVQLGVNEERCPSMENIDCNLVGKTTIDDILTILANSRLHIDSEGGYVHMRHALKGGKSVVLFGPTSKEFFGYSENINLRSSICPLSCEHIVEKWDTYCHITRSEIPACMQTLLPENVLLNIIEELNPLPYP